MVQRKTGKIALKKFFHERKIHSIEGTECAFGERKELMRHILIQFSQFGGMRRTLCRDEVRKVRYNSIDLFTIRTTLAYLKKTEGIVQKTGCFGQFQGVKWGNTT